MPSTFMPRTPTIATLGVDQDAIIGGWQRGTNDLCICICVFVYFQSCVFVYLCIVQMSMPLGGLAERASGNQAANEYIIALAMDQTKTLALSSMLHICRWISINSYYVHIYMLAAYICSLQASHI